MGSDLFGSYAESSCAALVVASISSFGINHEFTPMMYPLLISSMGIIACLITTLFATDFFEIKAVDEIEPALKKQLIISTAVMTVGIAVVSWLGLPYTFTIFNFGAQKTVYNWYWPFSNFLLYFIRLKSKLYSHFDLNLVGNCSFVCQSVSGLG
jgi:H+-translocating diphosphatase